MRRQRFDTILSTLRNGPTSAAALATILQAPQASVRRAIGTLREEGHVIDDARDNNGQYRLNEVVGTAAPLSV